VFTGIGAAFGSRRELTGLRPLVARLAIAALTGGLIGAALLLLLPERAFELVVPVLIAFAAVMVLVGPRLRERPWFRPEGLRPGPVAAYVATAAYTGYFGAAGGVLAVATLSTIIDRPFHDVNAAKNVLSAVANGAAATVFVLVGPVGWAYVLPLAAGLFTGGLLGPSVARRLDANVLRWAVGLSGLAVAAILAWTTYVVASHA
jgi:uncharacterized membrane protein YfcA